MPGKFDKIKPNYEVVISGIAGRFPESADVTELKENLFNKVDLATNDNRRWKPGHMDTPHRFGKIGNLEKFDAEFFGIPNEEALKMDPMARMLLEHTYEAIIDAGVNPRELRGTNTGIFIGVGPSESAKELLYDIESEGSGIGLTGCARFMMANRISHWLGCTGPSYIIDSACSSSLFAVHNAYRAIISGECDAALVAGSNLCLHPNMTRGFFKLGVLSADGCSKAFDADADGYCRSEAASAIYLQRAKDARRAYAQLVHTKTNCDGFKEEGITFPSSTMQRALLETFYRECRVPPSSVAFVEAHGTGTVAGDPVEAKALEDVFCPGRTTPFRIGSVKSNMGHAEMTSGLCSIAKVIIAMESGYIPPNLHYNRPREEIQSLLDGRIQVISEPTPWEGGYIGINSFGFGGANAHILLKSNQKQKIRNAAPNDNVPRLVVISGRTEAAVSTLLDDLESRPVDVEYISLFHNIHAKEIRGHSYRGYTVLPASGLPEDSVRDIKPHHGVQRPVCFAFSGIGSQWTGMGRDLLQIPAFAEATERCNAYLKPYDLNIIDILCSCDPRVFDNVVNSFVGTAAIQIGLVDVLATIGITSDITIGYSTGELGCAYATGCLTAEQVILAAYFQGLALIQAQTIRGSMATVGLSHGKLQSLCPADIDIACHNTPGSTTISGPAKSVQSFVSSLKAKGISAKEEPCSNIAYHSRYITEVGPKLLLYLQEVIPNPRPRSTTWLSTSIPCRERELSLARLCSPEYFMNNLLSPVLFDETLRSVPDNAITIEIGPHSVLHNKLKDTINVALTHCAQENRVEFLLQAIGKLYVAGLHPQLTNLYPKISYPVSRATPMISPLLRWDHSEDYRLVFVGKQDKLDSGERTVDITLEDVAFEWMAGHVIDGRNLVPATGYLVIVWETLAMMRGELQSDVSVVFEDVRFIRATNIPKKSTIVLELMIQKGSGRFEVSESGVIVVTGFIRAVSHPTHDYASTKLLADEDEKLDLTPKDIYRELRLRGYQYQGLFRGLRRMSKDGTKGRIAWNDNWATFIDNMLQSTIFRINTRELFVPTGIRKLVINTEMHANQLLAMPHDNKEFNVVINEASNIIVSGGVEIQGLNATVIARKKPAGEPVLEDFKFVSHRDGAEGGVRSITRIATQIVLENMLGTKIKTAELISDTQISPGNLSSIHIREVFSNIPLLKPDINIIAPLGRLSEGDVPNDIKIIESETFAGGSGAFMVISHGLLAGKNERTLKIITSTMLDGGFLLAREPLNTEIFQVTISQELDIVLEKRTNDALMILFRKKLKLCDITAVIKISNFDFTWLETLKESLKLETDKPRHSRGRILLVSEADQESGLLGLVNCLRQEPGGELIQGLLIQDQRAPKFTVENDFYSKQLKLGLTLNVLRPHESWGSYRFLPMEPLKMRPVYHAQMNQHTRGDLTAMEWVQGIIQPSCKNQNVIQIHYSSINFRDVMISTGKLAIGVADETKRADECVIGFEFSGKDVDGRAVMGLVKRGALSNLCIGDKQFLWAVPDDWTLEDAATVPAVYGTVYYALFLNGKMKMGDKVLIHSGSGGVGQAAIRLALHTGCEVFTTVGTLEKREFIKNQFPQIDDDHIGNSRDTSFEQLILRKTKGQGVDIVLNSLAEEKLQASVRCLAIGGRFVEIGKFDLMANNPLGLEAFLKGISFHGVLLDTFFTASHEEKFKLAAMVSKGITSGAIKPLVRTVFPMDQVEAAFRYMAAGKHIGKVILKIRDDDDGPLPQAALALSRYYCSEVCSYLILGGLGGFGLELADWLVLRGAKKLVLTSRKGISNGYQRMRINAWQSCGVSIAVVAGKDASTHEGCEAILKEATTLGPVDAIFNLAVVLKDAFFKNQTVETFEESFKAKAWATKRLDELSRIFCPDLKHFVVFSSVSCGRGNAGQTNYGMSNSIMERICETRVAEGFPGLAIQWGAIGDVGLVADMQEDNKELVIGGTLQQGISSCLQVLDRFLQQNSTVVSSMVVAEKRADGTGATNVVDTVVNIMGLKNLKTISLHTPLAELGMDSMMGVEIKQTLERDFEVFLTAMEIRSMTFAKLQEISRNQATGIVHSVQTIKIETRALSLTRMLIPSFDKAQLTDYGCMPLVTKSRMGGSEVFLIPGAQGASTVFHSLARKLKSPATCLHFGVSNRKLKTADDIADFFIPHVRARRKGCNDFTIAGYSFGSLVAIELVRRLESEGFNGRLVLLDGSPAYLKELTNPDLSGDEEQSNFLLALMCGIAPSIVPKLASKLESCNTWTEKLTAFGKDTPEEFKLMISEDEQVAIVSALYSRLEVIRNYDSSVSPPLKTPITLIRPKMQILNSMSEDYDLKSVTQGKVTTYYAKGDHLTMLHDDVCAAVINGDFMDSETSMTKTRSFSSLKSR